MKKSLLLCTLLGTILLAGCSTTNSTKCPEWSEYWESTYENWNIKAQWCFKIDSDEMEWHWIYYFENWWKDTEWDMSNDLEQWKWIFYDENWNNIIIIEWNYEDGLEDGERKYYDDSGNYICSDIYSKWDLTEEWSCPYDYEVENENDDEIE